MPTISALGIGSGLDLNGLLSELESAERSKLAPITANKQSYQVKLSAYGQLNSALSRFQAAVEKLSDASLFSSVTAAASGDAVAASADNGAAPGVYKVNVSQLAQSYSVATEGLLDKEEDLGAGTITFSLNNGTSFAVSVEAEHSSLEDICDAINIQNGGVIAAMVNDGSGSPYRLVLGSSNSGTESAISGIDFGDLASVLAKDDATEIVATNALMSINGIDIQGQSNQLQDVIDGITLSLVEEGSSIVTVAVDDNKIEKAIANFVSEYNKVQEVIDTLGGYDQDSGVAGKLVGDSTLRTVESRLKNILVDGVSESDIKTLSAIGIKLQLDGTLEVDDEALSELIKTNRLALADFFSTNDGEEGLAGKLNSSLDQMLDGSGLLEARTDGLKGSIERLDERYANIESNIAKTVSRYRLQFGSLDSLVSKMNSTSSYISQQFDIMNAQLTN